ncbi:glycosyltransferase [Autumnicola musiva]|uniref:Glycosyltransferase n=1 Tax=Autumnicola musiva TaxID=3075589 RepID=A0ABU3D840_9FLAO|nr:glycosyltransferase [Zunongwangia sp. F117]MDT0677695.1 glycosyltransferase [Zunongwangia sp. F117]
MRVLHISTFQKGGAGMAAFRLHKQLLSQGVKSEYLFLLNGEISEHVHGYYTQNRVLSIMLRVLKKAGLPLDMEQRNDFKIRKYKRKVELFSFARTPYSALNDHILFQQCDLIHLHFIANFVDFPSFFAGLNKPIIWTLHDMNPFMGGFHYRGDKERFGKALQDLDFEQFDTKKNALDAYDPEQITVVTPSKWLLNESKRSKILGKYKHKHISNGIDINTFTLQDKNSCRQKLGLNKGATIVLFVAESLSNYRKGFDMIKNLFDTNEVQKLDVQFVAIGKINESEKIPQVVYLGSINSEERMSEAYNAADIFLLPSREDNLPNTMIESLCCGTPIVGFNIGGVSETILNGFNGFLSQKVSAPALKEALEKCLQHLPEFDRQEIADQSQKKYSVSDQAKAFIELYEVSGGFNKP